MEGTRYDFRKPHRMSDQWADQEGYDQSFVIDKKEHELVLSAEAWSEESKTKLEVLTTEPVVHFYTGIGLPVLTGKNSTQYGPFSGFCFETQKHPNAINIPGVSEHNFTSGETYHHKTVYRLNNL